MGNNKHIYAKKKQEEQQRQRNQEQSRLQEEYFRRKLQEEEEEEEEEKEEEKEGGQEEEENLYLKFKKLIEELYNQRQVQSLKDLYDSRINQQIFNNSNKNSDIFKMGQFLKNLMIQFRNNNVVIEDSDENEWTELIKLRRSIEPFTDGWFGRDYDFGDRTNDIIDESNRLLLRALN